MPNPIISHQAPGLLLKMKFPKHIDVVAICIGAFVPDLTFYIGFRAITHSLLGQIYWTVPLTLCFTMIFKRYIAGFMSNFAKKKGFIPKVLQYFAVDDWEILGGKKFDMNFFLVASCSALIGGITHVLLDLPSHPYTVMFYPWIKIRIYEEVWISGVVWAIEDVFFFITTLYLLRMIKKKDLIRFWDAQNS